MSISQQLIWFSIMLFLASVIPAWIYLAAHGPARARFYLFCSNSSFGLMGFSLISWAVHFLSSAKLISHDSGAGFLIGAFLGWLGAIYFHRIALRDLSQAIK